MIIENNKCFFEITLKFVDQFHRNTYIYSLTPIVLESFTDDQSTRMSRLSFGYHNQFPRESKNKKIPKNLLSIFYFK